MTAQYNIVLWNFLSIIIYSGYLFASINGSFFCENYYDNAIKTLKSNRNDSIRLSILPTSSFDFDSFERAKNICQHCLDGSLVQHSDIKQLLPYLPLWIGLESRSNATTFNQTDWTWLDGSEFNQSEENYAVSIVYPEPFFKNAQYGFYAYPDNWNKEDSLSIGEILDYFINPDDKTSNRTAMKWMALWVRSYNQTNEMTFSINSNVTEEEKFKLGLPKFVACERPYRPSCHFCNYTQECFGYKNFGCLTYVNMMFQNSDNESVKCEAPKERRVAKRCPKSVCTCEVTEWGAWSQCGDEECSLAQTTRIRWRSEVDPACPQSKIHPRLSEIKPCKISGCSSLLADRDD